MKTYLSAEAVLPSDELRGTLVGRIWRPGAAAGPCVVAVREDHGVYDISAETATSSALTEHPGRIAIARESRAEWVCSLEELLANADEATRDPERPWPLAPIDLQAVKAAGVTFVRSMLERVIEERIKGDPGHAAQVRAGIEEAIGGALRDIVPGSPQALVVKDRLIEAGLWSQYLEVGIGVDAEIFTKTQPMASVGLGAMVGLHPASTWNNPEPEIVLVVASSGEVVGATLGNDVNLRDIEGRSALLLGRAKDNNGSSSVGPFIRLFDKDFGIDDVRRAEVRLTVQGEDDGFELRGSSSMSEISRDPLDLAAQLVGPHHQYPDGAVLFCGTMFAPVQDRDGEGQGFTHHEGDIVAIETETLGTLVNRVGRSTAIAPWTFGTRALMHNLAGRGLLR